MTEQNRVGRPFLLNLLAILALMGAVSSGVYAVLPQYPVVPFTNGIFFLGNHARVYMLALAFINLYIFYGFLKLQKAAWFTYIVFSLVSIIIGVYNTLTVSQATLFRSMFQLQSSSTEAPIFFYKAFGLMAMLIYVMFLVYVFAEKDLFFKKKK